MSGNRSCPGVADHGCIQHCFSHIRHSCLRDAWNQAYSSFLKAVMSMILGEAGATTTF